MDTNQVLPLNKVTKEELKHYFKDVYKLGDEQIVIMLESSAKSLNSSLNGLYAILDGGDDHEATARLAHSMKGLLLNMGQVEWSKLAREIELNAEKLDKGRTLELVKELHRGVGELL